MFQIKDLSFLADLFNQEQKVVAGGDNACIKDFQSFNSTHGKNGFGQAVAASKPSSYDQYPYYKNKGDDVSGCASGHY